MKKLFAVLITASLVFALSSCGSSAKEDASVSEASAAETASKTESVQEAESALSEEESEEKEMESGAGDSAGRLSFF